MSKRLRLYDYYLGKEVSEAAHPYLLFGLGLAIGWFQQVDSESQPFDRGELLIGAMILVAPLIAGILWTVRMSVSLEGGRLYFRDYWWNGEVAVSEILAVEHRRRRLLRSQGRLVFAHGTKRFRACVPSQLVLELGWGVGQSIPADTERGNPWYVAGVAPGSAPTFELRDVEGVAVEPFLLPKLTRDIRWNATHWSGLGPRRSGQGRPSWPHCWLLLSLAVALVGLVSELTTGVGEVLSGVGLFGLAVWFFGSGLSWLLGLRNGWGIDPLEKVLFLKKQRGYSAIKLASISSIETVTEGVRHRGWAMLGSDRGSFVQYGTVCEYVPGYLVAEMLTSDALSVIREAVVAARSEVA